MPARKGSLERLAETLGGTVEEVVQTVAVTVGIVPEPQPLPKSARKATRKAKITQVQEANQAEMVLRITRRGRKVKAAG